MIVPIAAACHGLSRSVPALSTKRCTTPSCRRDILASVSILQPNPRSRYGLKPIPTVNVLICVVALVTMAACKRHSGHTFEAKETIGSVRISEESYRAETMEYLNVSSSLKDWYPAKPSPEGRPWDNPKHARYAGWRSLNVNVSARVRCGFTVMAGSSNQTPPKPDVSKVPPWPTPLTEPWYVIQGACDSDGDGIYSVFVASSFNGEIYVDNEGE